MEIIISDSALKWFKEDIGLSQGDHLRFYTQIYGTSPIQKGYSLAFTQEAPIDMKVSSERDGIVFFIEDTDLWYFDGHNLQVDYEPEQDELQYHYVKN